MRTVAAVVAAVIIFTAGVTPVRSAQDPARVAAAQRALIAWFDCIECIDLELERLLRYSDLIEGALMSTLRTGATPARRAQIEERLRQNYSTSPSQREVLSETEYVRLFSENIDARYRKRAAIALGKLRTDNARRVLREEAENSRQRGDVRAAARQALEP